MVSRRWKTSILLLGMMSVLTGCFGEKQVLEPLDEGKGKLKVTYYSEKSFYSDYGNYFNIKFPDIEVEVISTAETDMEELLDKQKPDVVLLSEHMFETYAQQGKLYALDDIIAQEKFDLEGYMPGLIDMIRTKGRGKLYGLTPYFYNEVIYYNRDLFQAYNIELPRNQMSWQEILALSKRFDGMRTGDNEIYGLYQSPSSLLINIANTLSLQVFDAKGEKLRIRSDGWEQAMQMATDAVRNYPPGQVEGMNNLFLMGKAAMIMDGPWFAKELQRAPLHNKTLSTMNWDMVTVPVDLKRPDESSKVRLTKMYAIMADSTNKRAAWEFVQFVNGLSMEKVASRNPISTLPTRHQFFKQLEGRSTEPFYMLKPRLSTESSPPEGSWGFWVGYGNKHVPEDFYSPFNELLDKSLQAVMQHEITPEEAVNELDAKGQLLLNKTHAEEIKKKEAESAKENVDAKK
ncbi:MULTISPECIES: extracellular solute-binding protein [Paenibacillus]|uniref:ABC transporter substrate-binding protein n=1 Tax=Paenibacillus TaxID=44249 RepID=UPI00227E2421|nr:MULTISPECIES: extracellular solute-binding protein [Paenibacillus]MCY7483549.1 extracellular solute-binding protein [Paenibacillus alvei]